MRLLRKAIFWLHLSAGLLAGLVILVLATTGSILSFERQILESTTGITVEPGLASVGPEAILKAQADAKPAATALTYNSDPKKPAVVQFGRGKSIFVDPYNGESLGEGNVKTKQFFAWVLTVHRWFAQEGDAKKTASSVIEVANLMFLFLVVSGLWLWFPKRWTKSGWKAITRIQWRLKGRARDWNWHNVFGFWACVPLLFITTTGAIMSLTWANNLLFKTVGETPPPPRAEGGEGGGERRGQRSEAGGGREHGGRMAMMPVSFDGLDESFEAVKTANPGWQTIQISVLKGTTAQFMVAQSHRGRPDLRKTLTVDLTNFQTVKTESMESQSPGRQVRGWVRWIHTGEAFGWAGQAVMGLAAVSAIVLIWTGFALSWRRFRNRRKRTAA